jgi:GLPGLI family protein
MKYWILSLIFIASLFYFENIEKPMSQSVSGKAYYYSKTKMDLGNWGARMSEAQKKQMASRLKNRLEKTYILTFNQYESFFKEEEKLDAIGGATDTWGANFSRGDQYKNLKDSTLIQSQEFYGKRFVIKDELPKINWVKGNETKQIGNYLCFKAVATIPTETLNWYSFDWNDLTNSGSDEVTMSTIEAWYTLQIPLGHGPAEFWGLPGLVLEVSTGNTTILCSEISINTNDQDPIAIPNKGEETSIASYRKVVKERMAAMRNSYSRRRN